MSQSEPVLNPAQPATPAASPEPARLRREIGLSAAVLLGLGSILGTGVFVSIGIAAGIAGPMVLPAIALAGLVALCNALSSAQLAASHPVSGGTYEYGYRYLHPRLGFTAGWTFLCAKSASAATAALGLAAYLLCALNAPAQWTLPLALALVLALTGLTLAGLKRSARVNAVSVTVLVYYALTNLAALRLPVADRRFPRVFAVLGLCACLGLTAFIDARLWLTGV